MKYAFNYRKTKLLNQDCFINRGHSKSFMVFFLFLCHFIVFQNFSKSSFFFFFANVNGPTSVFHVFSISSNVNAVGILFREIRVYSEYLTDQ